MLSRVYVFPESTNQLKYMSHTKVIFINPNPRQMSLVQPVVALFYSIFKNHGIEMRFFDTTFYDVTETYVDSEKFYIENMTNKEVDSPTTHWAQPVKSKKQMMTDFRREMEEFQPDVLLASALESTVLFAVELMSSVRDLGVPHVLGGVFPTYAPEVAIEFKEVDVICVGESEDVVVPLVEKLKARETVENLPGIWVKTKDGISKRPIAPTVDLDTLPRFDGSIFHDSRFYRPMDGKMYRMFPIETHRGCPLVCTFCNSPVQNAMYKEATGDKYFRMKSISKVMEDVRYVIEEMGAEYLFFWADNFLAYSKGDIDKFCAAYSEYKIPFYAQSYPTTLNEYKLQKLVEVGLHRLGMGLEHGNEKFRAEIVNRPYSNKKAVEQTRILKKHGIQYSLNNIVGFPTETPDLHMDTVEINREIDPHATGVSIFTPFYGTPLRELSVKMGFLKDPSALAPTNSENSILEMPQFTKDQISAKAKVFNLYVKFPKNRWNDIKKAEAVTQEGDRIFRELKEEYAERYAVD